MSVWGGGGGDTCLLGGGGGGGYMSVGGGGVHVNNYVYWRVHVCWEGGYM